MPGQGVFKFCHLEIKDFGIGHKQAQECVHSVILCRGLFLELKNNNMSWGERRLTFTMIPSTDRQEVQ